MADDRPDVASADEGEPEHPRGTVFLMMMFLLLLIATWLYTYTTLVSRGI